MFKFYRQKRCKLIFRPRTGSKVGNKRVKRFFCSIETACIVFSSVVDLDPEYPHPDQIGSGFSGGSLIWIQEGKNGPEKYKTVNKFNFLKCWIVSFEG